MGVYKMSDLKDIFSKIDAEKPAMMETWRFLVDRDCGPDNKPGVDQVGADIRDFLEPLGFKVRFHEYEQAGNMLVAEYGDMTKPFIILTGHMDTVFAKGTSTKRPFKAENGVVTGPGVLDMKGGVTILLHVVKLLTEAGYDRYPIKIILAGDEETGHMKSNGGADYMTEAKGAVMGFNLETGFVDNGIVLARKGVAQFMMEIDGVGAHAGNNPEDGRSAVEELCHKVLDIQALTDWDEGTTVNTGVIAGGTVANAVPEHAWCKIDVRFKKQEGIARVEKALEEIAKKVYVKDTHTTVRCLVKVAAMVELPGSKALFEKAEAIAEDNGLPKMKPIMVGGGSDSAYLTMAGVPTLCALGVRGQYNHTVREYAEEDSLTERAKLLAALLMKL